MSLTVPDQSLARFVQMLGLLQALAVAGAARWSHSITTFAAVFFGCITGDEKANKYLLLRLSD